MARKLLAEERFQEAEEMLKKALAQGPLQGNEALGQLLAEAGTSKAQAVEAARKRQAEESFKAALALLNGGKLEEAEAALRKVDVAAAPDLAARVSKALEKDVPAARVAAAQARGRADLEKAEALLAEGNLDEARRAAETVKGQVPGLAGEADRLMAKVEQAKDDQQKARERELKNREKEAVAQGRALMKEGRLDEADKLLRGLVSEGPLQGNPALGQVITEVGAARQQAVLAARKRQAEEQYESAMAMVRGGRLDEAEAALKRIAPGDSAEVAAKTERTLAKEIPDLRKEQRRAAGLGEVARAEKLLGEGQLEEAQKLVEAAARSYPEVARGQDRRRAQGAGQGPGEGDGGGGPEAPGGGTVSGC
ncbi:MAG: hypothetical protein HYU36_12955 [Planctomycetes bacterium]|nr:hypothetical protein [Planctomycetota bacterium]